MKLYTQIGSMRLRRTGWRGRWDRLVAFITHQPVRTEMREVTASVYASAPVLITISDTRVSVTGEEYLTGSDIHGVSVSPNDNTR